MHFERLSGCILAFIAYAMNNSMLYLQQIAFHLISSCTSTIFGSILIQQNFFFILNWGLFFFTINQMVLSTVIMPRRLSLVCAQYVLRINSSDLFSMIRFADVFEKQNSYFETFKCSIDGHQTKLSHTVRCEWFE